MLWCLDVSLEFCEMVGDIPHSPFSSDLIPCESVLSSKMKLKLKGCCFDTKDEIQTELQVVFNSSRKDFCSVLEVWKKCRDCSVYSRENYFQRDGN